MNSSGEMKDIGFWTASWRPDTQPEGQPSQLISAMIAAPALAMLIDSFSSLLSQRRKAHDGAHQIFVGRERQRIDTRPLERCA